MKTLFTTIVSVDQFTLIYGTQLTAAISNINPAKRNY